MARATGHRALGWLLPAAGLVALLLLLLWQQTSWRDEPGLARITRAFWAPAPETQDDIPAQAVDLPHFWDSLPAPHAQGTYTFAVPDEIATLPHAPGEQSLAIAIPRVATQYRLLVNGIEVDEYGWHANDAGRTMLAGAQPRFAAIPTWALRDPPSPNIVAIQVRGVALDRPGLSTVIIGAKEAVRERYLRLLFWQQSMTAANAVIGALVMAAGLYLWTIIQRPQYLLVAASAAFFMARSIALLTQSVSIPYNLFFLLDRTFLIGHSLLFVLAIEVFLQNKESRPWFRRFVRYGATSAAAAAFVATTASAITLDYQYTPLGLALLLMVSITALTVSVFQYLTTNKHQDNTIVFAGTCFVLLAAARDFFVIHFGIGGDDNIRWMSAGSTALLIIFGIALSRELVRLSLDLQSLSDTLAQRVAQRERELEEAYSELRAKDAIEHRQRERQRIMRDLHDGIGSQLATAITLLKRSNKSTQECRAAALGMVQSAMQTLRLTLDSLEPHEGSIPTLMGVIRARLQPSLQAAGIELKWRMHPVQTLDYMDDRAALNFLFLIQEVFTNAIKHSGASCISVEVDQNDDEVWLSIEDNGRGMSESSFFALDDPEHGGRGIQNMHERAARCGATLRVYNAAPGVGVRLSFSRTGHPVAQDAFMGG